MPNNLFALCAHALAPPGIADLQSACRVQLGDPRLGDPRLEQGQQRRVGNGEDQQKHPQEDNRIAEQEVEDPQRDWRR